MRLVAPEHHVHHADAPAPEDRHPLEEAPGGGARLERPDDDVNARQRRFHRRPRRVAGRVEGDAALAGVVHRVPEAASPAQHVALDVLDPHHGRAQLGQIGARQRGRLVADIEYDDVLQERQTHRTPFTRSYLGPARGAP